MVRTIIGWSEFGAADGDDVGIGRHFTDTATLADDARGSRSVERETGGAIVAAGDEY